MLSIQEQVKEFNLPSVFGWAIDKMKHIEEKRENYTAETWSFSGNFNNRSAPKEFFNQWIIEGVEYVASVSVKKARYVGQKAFVSVTMSRYYA